MTWRCAQWRRPYKHLFPLALPSVGLCTDWKTSWWLDMFNAANIIISEFLQKKKKSSTDDVWRLTSIRGEHHKEGTWLPSLLSSTQTLDVFTKAIARMTPGETCSKYRTQHWSQTQWHHFHEAHLGMSRLPARFSQANAGKRYNLLTTFLHQQDKRPQVASSAALPLPHAILSRQEHNTVGEALI